ncbi:MAG: OmpH family outer membrane protein, partial [Acidobacteriota bacterium]|nr:OmpH family outer membrane protein [Acidobacteriota bacterium]
MLIALAVAALGASAQQIAVIDMQGAILQTKDGQKAAADLRAKYDSIQQSLAKRGQDLQAKQADYQKNSATMSDDAKAAAGREMQRIENELQRDADDAKNDAQTDQNKMLQPILQKFQAVLDKYAAEKKIEMIVDLSSRPNNLLFASAEANITNDVIARYNAQSG